MHKENYLLNQMKFVYLEILILIYFFEGHYILKKYFKRLKEAQLKYIKPYVETFLGFGLNQLI